MKRSKTNYAFVFVLIFVCVTSCTKKTIKQFSCKIYNQKIIPAAFLKNSFYTHKQVSRQKQAEFLNQKQDTLFILEGYDIQSAQITGSIWNKKGMINYRYSLGNVEILDKTIFSKSDIDLVSRFDTTEIRKREKIHGHYLGAFYYKAIRGIYIKNKLRLDHFSFDEFE
ncbi:hypothetical protein QNI19_28200 [Cytophagaceae bacterium DM2B3-1]|uniref:Lipoprotein n=1 Tax=Xanthocytophaga flava TaxID=3048013 RepID=A0ABT7CV92_9BACT|nr:hypothetical protein [Xanthocytophaga flavus]MDJ1496850.1 hypothetical protein [Xanthocytophaga flavus]